MRKTYLDNIKWITVVIVVIYHVIYMFNGIEVYGVIGPFADVQYQDAFQYIVYPWFMLLLFIASGMSSRFYLQSHNTKEFISSRTRKFLVPSTIGLFTVGMPMGYYNMLLGGALDQMSAVPKPVFIAILAVSGTGPLWYIQLLWLFSVILVWIRRVEKDRLYNIGARSSVIFVVACSLVTWGAAQILNTPVVTVYRFGIYGFGFLMGYFVFSHDEVMERIEKYWLPLTITTVILCIAFVMLYFGQPYAEASVLQTFLCNIYAWIASVAILAFMKKWGGFENDFTAFMSRKSWGLYLFHYLPLAMCAYYMSVYAQGLPVICYYIACAVASFIGAYVLYEVISRIPVLRFLACGLRGK